jgi:hypothetical protein
VSRQEAELYVSANSVNKIFLKNNMHTQFSCIPDETVMPISAENSLQEYCVQKAFCENASFMWEQCVQQIFCRNELFSLKWCVQQNFCKNEAFP